MKCFTFTFDDGYQSWVEAAKVLESHGYRGTFNVSLRSIVDERRVSRPRMFPPSDVLTWEELNQMQAVGHEIGSHGMRHIDLATANDYELEIEFKASQRLLASHGIQATTYASQFNTASSRAISAALVHYKTIRAGIGWNVAPVTKQVFMGLEPTTAIDAIEEERWIVGIWHDLAILDRFAAHVERVHGTGAEVVTVGEATSE